MADDEELVPLEAEIVSDAEPVDWESAAEQMIGHMIEAFRGMLEQDTSVVEKAERSAAATFAAIEVQAGPRERLAPDDLSALLMTSFLSKLVGLFAPLARGTVFQVEGRFQRALQELQKGLDRVAELLAAVDELERQPDIDADTAASFRLQVKALRALLRGSRAYVRADVVGFQGRVRRYLQLLQAAIAEFRKVEALPPSADLNVQSLVRQAVETAKKLETRVEYFELTAPKERYLEASGDKVFIIHGHDEAQWLRLRELLRDRFNVDAVVLKEEPGGGQTLIAKFEEYADQCAYAFALLTPDDFVKKGEESYLQARPNVLFELGWFFGRFGRRCVSILKKADTEIPSDLEGILSIDFAVGVEEVYLKIERELQRAGVIPAAV